MREVIAQTTHSEQRARDFYKFHLFKRSTNKYVYLAISIILIGVAVGFYFNMELENSLFFIFLAIMVQIVRIVIINNQVNNIVKSIVFPARNYSLKFTDEEIIYAYEGYKKSYRYSDLITVCETKNYYYFYITKNSALILSKYDVRPYERTVLEDMLMVAHVKQKKYRRK